MHMDELMQQKYGSVGTSPVRNVRRRASSKNCDSRYWGTAVLRFCIFKDTACHFANLRSECGFALLLI